MKAIDRYITLADEVISLYETYQVRNYTIQGIEYIKQLQRDVQTFTPQDIESELTDDYPDAVTLQRRLDFVEMKLDGYLIDCPISDDDWLGDGGARCKHLVAKLGQKIGMEYVIRLHSVLECLNDDSRVILEMIERLRSMDAKPQQDKEQTDTGRSNGQDGIVLPNELNTDEAKSILQNAINAGFCDTNYQWKKTKALLAYFADKASEYLGLGKGEYDGKAKTSWKPFESLFGISGLSGAKRDYQKTGTLPDGYKDVDNLF